MNRDVVATGIVLVSLLFAPFSTARGEETVTKANQAYSWAAGTQWDAEIDWLDRKLQDCRSAEDRSEAVCGTVVAEAMERVYGIRDFHEAAVYLDHGAIGIALTQPGSGWQALGTADDQDTLDAAQEHANAGNPVLAVQAPRYGGHVTIVLPGGVAPSSSWQRKVPNSASFFIAKSRRSFVGKRLSFAYDRESAAAVTLYSRTGEPGDVATASYETAALASTGEDRANSGDAVGTNHGGLTFDKSNSVSEAEQQLFESALAAALLAPAAGESGVDDANATTQQAALPPDGFFGVWCDARADSDSKMVNAVKIDQQAARLSWGQADRTRAYAFETKVTHAILEIEQEGAIVGISFSQSDGETADATAFFVIDGADKLFESHIFDETSSEIRAHDTMLRRCADAES